MKRKFFLILSVCFDRLFEVCNSGRSRKRTHPCSSRPARPSSLPSLMPSELTISTAHASPQPHHSAMRGEAIPR
jgi:hypothetical protein